MDDLQFSHFGIFAIDPELLGKFYVNVLGFTVTDRGKLPSGALVFLSRDPTEHHQIILCSGRPPSGFNTVNQISLRARNLAVIKDIHKKVSQMDDVTDIQTVSHGNAVSTYFRDPEGNRIEVFVDAPFYCAQPQRIPVDIHQSDTAIWQQVEEHARSQPGFKPRAEWVAEMRELMKVKPATTSKL